MPHKGARHVQHAWRVLRKASQKLQFLVVGGGGCLSGLQERKGQHPAEARGRRATAAPAPVGVQLEKRQADTRPLSAHQLSSWGGPTAGDVLISKQSRLWGVEKLQAFSQWEHPEKDGACLGVCERRTTWRGIQHKERKWHNDFLFFLWFPRLHAPLVSCVFLLGRYHT